MNHDSFCENNKHRNALQKSMFAPQGKLMHPRNPHNAIQSILLTGPQALSGHLQSLTDNLYRSFIWLICISLYNLVIVVLEYQQSFRMKHSTSCDSQDEFNPLGLFSNNKLRDVCIQSEYYRCRIQSGKTRAHKLMRYCRMYKHIKTREKRTRCL